ncbi:MAG: MaoC family dehydratase [Myxococcales bacterium]
MTRRIEISGPYFEDLHLGQRFDDAPSVTLTSGHAALHEAFFADRLRLPLDATLSEAVTGRAAQLANPSLVCNVAIGQTTTPSQRVRGNLFYRGLVLQRPVFLGDTLRTTTTVVGLAQNKPKPGRPSTGMVALEMLVKNQDGDTVLHFWRCPMLPCRDPAYSSSHADTFEAIPATLAMETLTEAVPKGWHLDLFRSRVPGEHFAEIEEGTTYVVEGRDTVTSAPELVRLTLNQAMTHTDATTSAYKKRLVYGGHTISMGASQISRALPNLVTILAWRSCDHTGPVFEGDLLRTEVTVTGKEALALTGGLAAGLVELHAKVFAERGDQAPEVGKDISVLDWRLVGLMA